MTTFSTDDVKEECSQKKQARKKKPSSPHPPSPPPLPAQKMSVTPDAPFLSANFVTCSHCWLAVSVLEQKLHVRRREGALVIIARFGLYTVKGGKGEDLGRNKLLMFFFCYHWPLMKQKKQGGRRPPPPKKKLLKLPKISFLLSFFLSQGREREEESLARLVFLFLFLFLLLLFSLTLSHPSHPHLCSQCCLRKRRRGAATGLFPLPPQPQQCKEEPQEASEAGEEEKQLPTCV